MHIIKHEQFNQLIDLLGHAANAEAIYRSVVLVNEDSPELKNKAQQALTNYCAHVAALYHPQEPPLVYLEAFNNKGETYQRSAVTMHAQKGAVSQIRYSIYIGHIIAQIKQDFSVVENNDTGSIIPINELAYTGIFKLVDYATCTIESDISNCNIYRSPSIDGPQLNFEANPAGTYSNTPRNHYETAFQHLIMRTLSHPAIPIISMILFLGGIGLLVSGSTVLGICTALIGTSIAIAGYTASRHGFFARYDVSTPADITRRLGLGPQRNSC